MRNEGQSTQPNDPIRNWVWLDLDLFVTKGLDGTTVQSMAKSYVQRLYYGQRIYYDQRLHYSQRIYYDQRLYDRGFPAWSTRKTDERHPWQKLSSPYLTVQGRLHVQKAGAGRQRPDLVSSSRQGQGKARPGQQESQELGQDENRTDLHSTAQQIDHDTRRHGSPDLRFVNGEEQANKF